MHTHMHLTALCSLLCDSESEDVSVITCVLCLLLLLLLLFARLYSIIYIMYIIISQLLPPPHKTNPEPSMRGKALPCPALPRLLFDA